MLESRDLLKAGLGMENNLYKISNDHISKNALISRNRAKKWSYGYDKDYDLVVISKDGVIGDIYDINGLKVGIPKAPEKIESESDRWVAKDYPKDLSKIRTIFDWNRRDNTFKSKYVDYIESEFDRRDYGHWFINNGTPTYITGTHYMYLQWTKIDIGKPDFRESNRIFYIFWEAAIDIAAFFVRFRLGLGHGSLLCFPPEERAR